MTIVLVIGSEYSWLLVNHGMEEVAFFMAATSPRGGLELYLLQTPTITVNTPYYGRSLEPIREPSACSLQSKGFVCTKNWLSGDVCLAFWVKQVQ